MPSINQKTPVTMCAKCHKMFLPGDRVSMVMIVQKLGVNPDSRAMESMLSPDFELAHITCADRALEGRLITP